MERQGYIFHYVFSVHGGTNSTCRVRRRPSAFQKYGTGTAVFRLVRRAFPNSVDVVSCVFRTLSSGCEPVCIGHLVIFADAEIDQVPVGKIFDRLPLGPLDFLELVNFVRLAVVRTADALGKQVLEIIVCHVV